MKQFFGLGLIAASVFVLQGCGSKSTNDQARMNVPDVEAVRADQQYWQTGVSLSALSSLKGMEPTKAMKHQSEIGDGSRYQALRDTAYEVGIQAGLYHRRVELNQLLKDAQPQLARIFDFSPYMLPGNIFPPVITETNGMLRREGQNQLRKVRHSYHVVTMPQVVIEVPTYLNYLVRHYPVPVKPSFLRLPVGEVEQKNWQVWVAEGWDIGRRQADLQYEADKNKLQRDLMGIRLFHDLVAKNVISMPRITRQDFGVIKSKDGRTLSIGDEILTITQDPGFQKPNEWFPISEGAN